VIAAGAVGGFRGARDDRAPDRRILV